MYLNMSDYYKTLNLFNTDNCSDFSKRDMYFVCLRESIKKGEDCKTK